MPYKSDAQRKYFNWAGAHGKIAKSTVNEFNQASRGMKLPEKVKPQRHFSGGGKIKNYDTGGNTGPATELENYNPDLDATRLAAVNSVRRKFYKSKSQPGFDNSGDETNDNSEEDTDEDEIPDQEQTTQPVIPASLTTADPNSTLAMLQNYINSNNKNSKMQQLLDQYSNQIQGSNRAPGTGLNNLMAYYYGPNAVKFTQPEMTPAQKTLAQIQAESAGNKQANTPLATLAKVYAAQLGNQTKRDVASNRGLPGGKPSPGQAAEDKDSGKSISDYIQGGGAQSAQSGIDALTSVRDALDKDPSLVGGMSNYLPEGARTLINPQGVDAQQTVQKAILGDLKHVFVRPTEKEMMVFLNKSYDPRLPAQDNVTRLTNSINELKAKMAAKEDAKNYFVKNNGSLQGYNPIHVIPGTSDGIKKIGNSSYKKVPGGWQKVDNDDGQ